MYVLHLGSLKPLVIYAISPIKQKRKQQPKKTIFPKFNLIRMKMCLFVKYAVQLKITRIDTLNT